ncbi:hypothetical protein BaRGS_00002757 [Batillaria attramentaria]|uniref:Uncharacterized protein n=1 Tax=Batillaria attramentaria TaxID=370345 RepID=A0ABD0M2Q6_9CAEN
MRFGRSVSNDRVQSVSKVFGVSDACKFLGTSVHTSAEEEVYTWAAYSSALESRNSICPVLAFEFLGTSGYTSAVVHAVSAATCETDSCVTYIQYKKIRLRINTEMRLCRESCATAALWEVVTEDVHVPSNRLCGGDGASARRQKKGDPCPPVPSRVP